MAAGPLGGLSAPPDPVVVPVRAPATVSCLCPHPGNFTGGMVRSTGVRERPGSNIGHGRQPRGSADRLLWANHVP